MSEDAAVRACIYDVVMSTGRAPSLAEIAATLGESESAVRAAASRLAEAHMLALQPESGEILMAMPWSAVPTPFVVRTDDGVESWGNCIWDAAGIAVMTERDAVIESACGCCGSAMTLHVDGGTIRERDGVAHFALPVRRWWDDVAFT